MYRNDWHKAHQAKTRYSASVVASLTMRHFNVKSVIDVGCGHGDWLKAFLDLGVKDIVGCDGPWTDPNVLLIPEENFVIHDLRTPFSLGRIFDMAISTEVGEHIEERYADQFVASIVAHSDLVLFGAAIPYQGGYKHINEQWPSWWAEIFRRFGYEPFNIVRPAIWDDPSVHFWYKQNALIYVKTSRPDLVGRATEAFEKTTTPSRLINVVHPEKFEDLASYRSIAFKPLAKNFPHAFASRLYAVLTGQRKS